MMLKVLTLWDVPAKLRKYLQDQLSECAELIFPDDFSENNLCRLVGDVDVIIGWRPTISLLKSAQNLKLYINPGAGVEHQVEIFKQFPQVILVNSHGNSYAVAQHSLAMLLTLVNQIIPHHQWMNQGIWRTSDDDAKSYLLRRKTVGLLGYGAIGQQFSRFIAGFELRQIVYKKRPLDLLPEYINQIFYGDDFNEFLRQSDILLVSLPHNRHTENMIGIRELKLLGKDGIILNVGRGPVVNQEALYTVLKDEIIAGAAIDVWYGYEYQPTPNTKIQDRPYSFPFHQLTNIILSPHRADSPEDDLIRWEDVIINIRKLSVGKDDFLNIVNVTEGY